MMHAAPNGTIPLRPAPTSFPTVPITGRPVVLPDIEVTAPTPTPYQPNVKVTTSILPESMPWWVWLALGIGVLALVSGKAGRRRSSW